MTKDPAFLFYPGDWLGGTMTFSRLEKGVYIDLLICQFNNGHMTLQEIESFLGQDFYLWESKLSKKFIQDEQGKYFNQKLEDEINRRKKYTNSRRNNQNGYNQYRKKKVLAAHMTTHMRGHMENENEIENEIEIEKKKGSQKWTSEQKREVLDLIELFKPLSENYYKIKADLPQRAVLRKLIKTHGLETVQSRLTQFAKQKGQLDYDISIHNAYDLDQKWDKIKDYLLRIEKSRDDTNKKILVQKFGKQTVDNMDVFKAFNESMEKEENNVRLQIVQSGNG